jgi:phospholipid transport system substrate-binding protein
MKGTRTVMMVFLLLPALLLSISLTRPFAESPEGEAKQVAKRLNDTLLESMKKGGELGYSGRYKLLQPVIEESFSLPYIARISLGKYWTTITDEQKALLMEHYTEWSVASYAARFYTYSGEKFEMLPETGTFAKTLVVTSKLTSSTDVVDFTYQLMPVEGKMRIVDVKVEGVSQLALTRSQFVSIMERQGIDGLVSTLKEKTQKLASGK